MSRQLLPPVVMSAGHTRSRTAPPRGLNTRRRAPTYEKIQPTDVGLGELFVHTRDAIVVGNVESGSIALWNPAAERLFGWTAAEAIGQPIEILIPTPIVRLHQEGLALYRRAGGGSLIDSGSPIEVPALTRDGEEVRVELTLASLDHAAASGKYVLAIFRDVSDRRRADLLELDAARADAARAELEHKIVEQEQAIRDGAADVDRELERVRRVAAALSRALAEPEQRDARRLRQRAQVVVLRAERARSALEEVATSAAIQSGSMELDVQRVNLVPLVSRVVADVRARSTPCKVNMAVPQGLTAVVDPIRVEQVVRTLVDRAMRRNPRGCWVDVELRRPLVGLARLEIRDVGRPLSPRRRERLLAGDRGLSMCRYIVEQHGGTLAVEFPPEGGVRVVVTLPTQRARVMS